ncbi:MAG: Uma2 family endonuclease [Chloroflexi bacterium]|nr:Uma2 family endonuclease [Chloroflexota bacterium]
MAMQAVAEQTQLETDALITGEELLEMGDMGPCELVEGRIVPMSPTKIQHGRFEYKLARLLGDFVAENNLGEIMVGEVGIYVQRDPDTIRAADILFISHERLAQASPNSFLDVPPELVVEILSPSDRWNDVRRKLREYFAAGVNVVLIIEPDEQTVSVYRAPTALQELTGTAVLTLDDILPGFRCVVADLFAS